jgi:hypothetical protein
MGLGPFIVIIKELKAYLFNAKEKREIPYGYWRSLATIQLIYTSCEVD